MRHPSWARLFESKTIIHRGGVPRCSRQVLANLSLGALSWKKMRMETEILKYFWLLWHSVETQEFFWLRHSFFVKSTTVNLGASKITIYTVLGYEFSIWLVPALNDCKKISKIKIPSHLNSQMGIFDVSELSYLISRKISGKFLEIPHWVQMTSKLGK